jgi:hypothetical protein
MYAELGGDGSKGYFGIFQAGEISIAVTRLKALAT